MKKINAVVFDMDGVLLDTETICDRTWYKVAEERKISNIQKAMQSCRGMNKADSYITLKKLYGEDFDVEGFMQRTSELFHEIETAEGINLMPYVKEALEYLKPRYRIILASSTRGPVVKRQLADADLINYFETLTTGDMVTHSKPHPEIYLMACKSIGENPENCVAIEDSPNGIKSAFSAGLKTIMIPDKIQPDEEITKLCWKITDSLQKIEEIL